MCGMSSRGSAGAATPSPAPQPCFASWEQVGTPPARRPQCISIVERDCGAAGREREKAMNYYQRTQSLQPRGRPSLESLFFLC